MPCFAANCREGAARQIQYRHGLYLWEYANSQLRREREREGGGKAERESESESLKPCKLRQQVQSAALSGTAIPA